MAWELGDYKAPPLDDIKIRVRNAPGGGRAPFTTAFHMYEILIDEKRPVCEPGQPGLVGRDEMGISPAQCRRAFKNGWVPEHLVEAMAACAASDGDDWLAD